MIKKRFFFDINSQKELYVIYLLYTKMAYGPIINHQETACEAGSVLLL